MANEDVVILTGLNETLEALKEFDKGAVRRFNKVINNELRTAKKDAQALIYKAVAQGNDYQTSPLSGWQTKRRTTVPTVEQAKVRPWPIWDTEEVVSGIYASRVTGKVRADYTTSAGALINSSRAGAIFEIAGRLDGDGRTPQGTAFKEVLNRKFGEASRVVWRIVDRDRLKIQANVVKALDEAKEELQHNLDKRHSK